MTFSSEETNVRGVFRNSVFSSKRKDAKTVQTKSGKRRPGQIEKDGVLYVNAAEVPRHRKVNGRKERHHVRLRVTSTEAKAEDIWI